MNRRFTRNCWKSRGTRRHTRSGVQGSLPRVMRLFAVIGMCTLLFGCMYPENRRAENQVSGLEYLVVVQNAIEQYQAHIGVLPIKTSQMDTPIYEKYVIDFKRLTNSPYLSQIPPNAFENGGKHIYVLIDVEEKPTVKLLDLVTAQRVNDVQIAVDSYILRNEGKLPIEKAYEQDGYFYIDFKAIGMASRPEIKSVFSGQYLRLLMNDKGKVFVDYAPDIVSHTLKHSITIVPDRDPRAVLTDLTPFVPVKSPEYHWVDNEPILVHIES